MYIVGGILSFSSHNIYIAVLLCIYYIYIIIILFIYYYNIYIYIYIYNVHSQLKLHKLYEKKLQ